MIAWQSTIYSWVFYLPTTEPHLKLWIFIPNTVYLIYCYHHFHLLHECSSQNYCIIAKLLCLHQLSPLAYITHTIVLTSAVTLTSPRLIFSPHSHLISHQSPFHLTNCHLPTVYAVAQSTNCVCVVCSFTLLHYLYSWFLWYTTVILFHFCQPPVTASGTNSWFLWYTTVILFHFVNHQWQLVELTPYSRRHSLANTISIGRYRTLTALHQLSC